MGSSYFGEPNFGRERSGGGSSSSSSSRKGKKSNSDKPKQPQRGLGVAQLEKIRLHSQVGSVYKVPTFQSPYLMMTHPNQEDIRLQSTYSPTSSSFPYTSVIASPSYGFDGPHNVAMDLGDMERGNVRHGESQPNIYPPRWNAGNVEAQHYQQSSSTRHFLGLDVEETMGEKKKKQKNRSHSNGTGSQNSGSSGSQELDLELRLSI